MNWGNFPDTPEGLKALRKAALDYYGSEFMKDGFSVFNSALKAQIAFNKESKKKIKSFSGDVRKLKLIKRLGNIIAQGRPIAESPQRPHDRAKSKGVEVVHILRAPVVLDGEKLTVRTTIYQMTDGGLFYDHCIDREESEVTLGKTTGTLDSADAANPGHSALLPTKPSGRQRHKNSIAKGGMVFNLVIEGEEPESIDDTQASAPASLADGQAALKKMRPFLSES